MASFFQQKLPQLLSLAFEGEKYLAEGYDFFELQETGNGETFLELIESMAKFLQGLQKAHFEYWVPIGNLLAREAAQARLALAGRADGESPRADEE
jgi:hypothetical protein